MKNIVSVKDYPLGKNRSDLIFTPGGVNIKDITFENLETGKFKSGDCRISSESLRYQAEIAAQNGGRAMAENFYRAAELVKVESDKIIEIYNALRPYRSTEQDLETIVQELRNTYDAQRTADFIEEAAKVLKLRKKLKGDR